MKDVGVVVQSFDDSPACDRLVPDVPLSDDGGEDVGRPNVVDVGATSPQSRRKLRCDAE